MSAAQATDPRAVRSVAVVGEGPPAWMAAIALQRAFGESGLKVTLVAAAPPGAPRPQQDAAASTPDLVAFHRLLGVPEPDLLRSADATFAVGQQYSGWSGPQTSFLHAYGETGRPLRDLPFIQLWTKARLNGLRVGYEQFSLAAVSARNGRIAAAAAGARQGAAFGYHLDVAGYCALLQAVARTLGIEIVPGPELRVETNEGRIEAVHPGDGRTVAADLFVDCTGPDARLLAALGETGPGEAEPGPCDRMLLATAPPLSPLPLYGNIAAHEAGWLGLFPLAGRTAVVMGYGSGHLGEEEARRRLGRLAGLPLRGDVVAAPVEALLRRRLWVANCVAIGPAAFGAEKLAPVELLRDQIGIAHLIALLPVDRSRMIEADIYNDEVAGHYERLRDFEAAHYRLNRRFGERFWDEARDRPISDALAYKLALFEERGVVAQHARESFNADSWQATMIGHGLLPRSYDPQVDLIAEGDAAQGLQGILSAIKAEVGAMATHEAARARALRG